MNLKVKTEDRKNAFAGYVVTFIFLAAGSLFMYVGLKNADFSNTAMLSEQLMNAKTFACIIVAVMALFIAGLLLYYVFKAPKRFVAVLRSKKSSSYKGRDIVEMEFEVARPEGKVSNLPTSFKCYTEENNHYREGNRYALYIKESGWEARRVEELNGKKACEQMYTASFVPVVVSFMIILGGLFLFSLINIVSGLMQGKGVMIYVVMAIVSVLFSVVVFMFNRQWEKDNIKKIPVSVGRGAEKGNESLPINMQTPNFFSVEQIKLLELTFTERRLFDGNRNLLLKEVGGPLSLNERSVQDEMGNEIAKLTFDFLAIGDSYTVEIEGEQPFSIRRKIAMGVEYEVEGLDFEIHGAFAKKDYSICDLTGREVARITERDDDKLLHKLGDMDVNIQSGFENNIYILLLAICISEDYERVTNRRMD